MEKRPQLTGQLILLTGATSGIGKAVAWTLARAGAQLVLVCRDNARGTQVRQELQPIASSPVELLVAELSSLSAIRELAHEFRRRFGRLDVLINNAGVLRLGPRRLTPDGLEETFAVNHLASFLLTILLLDLLRQSPQSRVVNVASESHRRSLVGAAMNLADLQGEHAYSGVKAYGQSKLANVLFTYELARRLASGPPTVNCVHPGFAATNLVALDSIWKRIGWHLVRPFMLSPERAAVRVTDLVLLTEYAAVSGQYFCGAVATRSSAATYDRALAQKLWSVSRELTRLTAAELDAATWELVAGDG